MSDCPKIYNPIPLPLPLLSCYRNYLEETGEPIAAAILAAGSAGRGVEPQRSVRTPPQVAKQLGVDPATVIGWIRSNELKAANVGKGAQRPRYRIQQSDLNAFLSKRQPEKPAARTRRRRTDGDVIQFF